MMAAGRKFNIYPDRPGELKQVVKVNAGTLTVAEGKTFLGTDNSVSFAADLAVGDTVVAYEVNSAGDIVVAKREHGDLHPIGEVTSEPKLVGIEPAVGTHTYGNYSYEVEILFYGNRIRTRKVYVAQSSNITVNQFLKIAAHDGFDNELEASSLATSFIALDGITASGSEVTHIDIPVLEGYEIQTADVT